MILTYQKKMIVRDCCKVTNTFYSLACLAVIALVYARMHASFQQKKGLSSDDDKTTRAIIALRLNEKQCCSRRIQGVTVHYACGYLFFWTRQGAF